MKITITKLLLMLLDKSFRDIIIFIITVLTAIILCLQSKSELFEERLSSFRRSLEIIKGDPNFIFEKSIEFYREKYRNIDSISTRYMVAKKDWLCYKKLVNIKKLTFTIDEYNQKHYLENIKKIQANIRRIGKRNFIFGKRLLPYYKLNLVENVLSSTNDEKMFNGNTYAVSKIVSDNELVNIHVYVGGFYDFYNTCMGFSFELAHYRFIRKNQTMKLPLREKFDIFELTNRYCTIGVVTLTIFVCQTNKDNSKDKFILIHQRSEKVSESKNMLNAIPGGAFHPSIKKNVSKDLISNIVREFGEELFSKPEYFEISDTTSLLSDPFYDTISNNTYFLGAALNPQNCYLEILTLSIIDLDDENIRKVIKYDSNNVKISILENFKPNYEGNIELRRFSKEEMTNLRRTSNATSALREISAIVNELYDEIINIIE